jgi:hypothetical protein
MCAFLYPTSEIAGATWIGEYFRETMLVNGKLVGEEKSSSEGATGRERAAHGAPPCSEK